MLKALRIVAALIVWIAAIALIPVLPNNTLQLIGEALAWAIMIGIPLCFVYIAIGGRL